MSRSSTPRVAPLRLHLIGLQVRSDDIKSLVAKRMQASKANKVMASIMPEFATFQARSNLHLSLNLFF